jgi:hypothetical protein
MLARGLSTELVERLLSDEPFQLPADDVAIAQRLLPQALSDPSFYYPYLPGNREDQIFFLQVIASAEPMW